MLQKKHLTKLILASLVALSGNAVYAAENGSVTVDINYWKPSVNSGSQMRLPDSANANLKNDLGLDKKNSTSLTIKYMPNETQIWYIGGHNLDIKGAKALPHAFTFKNTAYAAGDDASSELKISNYQIGLHNKFNADSNFYTNYQINRTSLKTTIADNTIGQAQSRDKSFTSLGLGLGWESRNPNKLNYFAEINPLSLFGGGTYWEHKLGIKAPISQNMNLTLGYKIESIHSGKDKDANRTDAELRGMYFSLGGSF